MMKKVLALLPAALLAVSFAATPVDAQGRGTRGDGPGIGHGAPTDWPPSRPSAATPGKFAPYQTRGIATTGPRYVGPPPSAAYGPPAMAPAYGYREPPRVRTGPPYGVARGYHRRRAAEARRMSVFRPQSCFYSRSGRLICD